MTPTLLNGHLFSIIKMEKYIKYPTVRGVDVITVEHPVPDKENTDLETTLEDIVEYAGVKQTLGTYTKSDTYKASNTINRITEATELANTPITEVLKLMLLN